MTNFKNLPSWSYTAWQQYVTCPYQYEAERVSKRYPFVENEHTRYGNRGHKELELRHKDGKPLEEFKDLEPLVARFDPYKQWSFTELKLTVDRDLKPTRYDNWKGAFCRGIVDIGWKKRDYAVLLDYKFGKKKDDSPQLRLFAALGFAHWPEVQMIQTGFIWCKDRESTTEVYGREDAGLIWSSFIPVVEEIAESKRTGNWPKKPCGLCKSYCAVLDCEHNGKREK